MPGFVAIALLAANGWFVSVWLGPSFYAGDYVNGMIALCLVLRVGTGGLYKVVGVAGYRSPVGFLSVAGGFIVICLGYGFASVRGLAGLAEAGPVMLVLVLPAGLYLLARVYQISAKEYLTECVLPWLYRTAPLLLVAVGLSSQLRGVEAFVVIPAMAVLSFVHIFTLRPLLTRAPWPSRVRTLMRRIRLVGRTA
jgi:hypothetical protein